MHHHDAVDDQASRGSWARWTQMIAPTDWAVLDDHDRASTFLG
jgi:hypothetical protein